MTVTLSALQLRALGSSACDETRSSTWESRNDPNCALRDRHLVLGLSACTNPYDPVQRGFAGGLWGAASGAAIGAAAGGGPGAALGAAVGGATGILGGVASTPPPPPGTYYGYPTYGFPPYGYPGCRYPAYGYPGYPQSAHAYPGSSDAPIYPGSPTYEYHHGDGDTRLTPALRPMSTMAPEDTLLVPVPQPMSTTVMRDIRLIPPLRALDYRATWGTELILMTQPTDIRAARSILTSRVTVMNIPRTPIQGIALRKIGRLGPGMAWSPLAESSPSRPTVRSRAN
jgi:hypothetical protein